MTEKCRALLKYKNESKIGWYHWITTFYITKMIWHVEKGEVLGWTLSVINDSGMACWRPKIVTKGPVWSDQVFTILVNDIMEKTQGT